MISSRWNRWSKHFGLEQISKKTRKKARTTSTWNFVPGKSSVSNLANLEVARRWFSNWWVANLRPASWINARLLARFFDSQIRQTFPSRNSQIGLAGTPYLPWNALSCSRTYLCTWIDSFSLSTTIMMNVSTVGRTVAIHEMFNTWRTLIHSILRRTPLPIPPANLF